MPVDPVQIQLCALIRAHGSLVGAARELGLTPAAVTAQLARAESDWDARLVDRGPRGARLTALGDVLADAGETVLAAGRDARQRFDTVAGRAASRLRIGTFQTLAEHLLPQAVTALRHRRPDVELSIVETTSVAALEALAGHEVDVAVVSDYSTPSRRRAAAARRGGGTGPEWVFLATDPLVVCLPDDHRIVRAGPPRSVGLAALRDDAWIVVTRGHPARRQLEDAAHHAGFSPTIQFETDSYSTAQALVGTGIGIAAISELTARPTPGATHVPLARPRLSRSLFAVTWPSGPASTLASDFVTLLADAAREFEDRVAG